MRHLGQLSVGGQAGVTPAYLYMPTWGLSCTYGEAQSLSAKDEVAICQRRWTPDDEAGFRYRVQSTATYRALVLYSCLYYDQVMGEMNSPN